MSDLVCEDCRCHAMIMLTINLAPGKPPLVLCQRCWVPGKFNITQPTGPKPYDFSFKIEKRDHKP